MIKIEKGGERMTEKIKRISKTLGLRTVFGLLCGSLAGTVGIALYWSIHLLQQVRLAHGWTIFLLPAIGLLIIALYRGAKMPKDRSTNLVLQAARGGKDVPLRQGALIFLTTALSHLGGASVGREGAAVQIGGSIGDWLSRLFRVDGKERRLIVMSGVSAAFSAVFGTPLTAVIFPMEIAAAGKLSFAAFWPCAIASAVGYTVRCFTGAHAEVFHLPVDTAFALRPLIRVIAVAAGCALVSRLFCLVMKWVGDSRDRLSFMKNTYLRVAIGGTVVLVLTLIVGTRDYNGAGREVIARAIEHGEVVWYAFLLKILFTAVSLKSGYKGGEVVPTLFIGATAGCAIATLVGCSPSLGAAVGMVALFAGATDCPFSALLLGWELLGGGLGWYLLPAAVVGWFFSGDISLYKKHPSFLCRYRPK